MIMTVKQVPGLCLTLDDAVQSFLLDLEIGNRSPSTISAQRTVLSFLCAFAEESGWPSIPQISKPHMRQYLAALKARPKWFGLRGAANEPISDSYYETNYRRIKRFFNWCVLEGYLTANPMAGIPYPKQGQKVIPVVSEDDFQKLLKVTDPNLFHGPSRRFRAVRDQAALWMLMDTPGRKEELAALTLGTVDLKERRVLVRGKGRKERYMYMGAVTVRAMARYKALRDALNPGCDDWWVDIHGYSMSKHWMYRLLKRLCDRAGIPRIHTHQFRHTFSIHMIEANVPLPTLEVMGGWSRMPRTYLATLGDQAAKAAHRRASPADRLARGR